MFPFLFSASLKALRSAWASAGAPMDAARPLAIAGDPQGVLLRRFLAPQRGVALAALSAFRQLGT